MRRQIIASIVLSLLIGGCSGYRKPPTAFHEVLTQPYQLDSGDRLRVVVYEQANLSNSYSVDQAGYISVPLIGEVPVRGSTTQQLQATLKAKLSQGFLRDPDVSVEVEQYRPFFVMGEVRNAGQYSYVAGMTAQTAVAIAGGFNARAQQESVDITRQINGKIINGRVPLSDPLRPGDTIYIRERLF